MCFHKKRVGLSLKAQLFLITHLKLSMALCSTTYIATVQWDALTRFHSKPLATNSYQYSRFPLSHQDSKSTCSLSMKTKKKMKF